MGDSVNHTPGPWRVLNMVHAERGDAMTPEELGEYVANSVRLTIEGGGTADRFLFISTEGDGPDLCHVGNGPRGPFNAMLMAAAPDLLEALTIILPMAKGYAYANRVGRNAEKIADAETAIAKALGQSEPSALTHGEGVKGGEDE